MTGQDRRIREARHARVSGLCGAVLAASCDQRTRTRRWIASCAPSSRALTAGRMREMGALLRRRRPGRQGKGLSRRSDDSWRGGPQRAGARRPPRAGVYGAHDSTRAAPRPALDCAEGFERCVLGQAFMADERHTPVDLTRRALDLGVPIDDALDGENLSPLALAAKCRVVEVANYLLDRGARATSQALIWACASHGPATARRSTSNESDFRARWSVDTP